MIKIPSFTSAPLPKPKSFPCNSSDLPITIIMADNTLKHDNPKTQTYPVPLSPPLPQISKQIELNRAMSASSTSALFSLSSEHIIFQDQWLLVVNKPQGVYCETILSSVPPLLDSPTVELHLANRLDRDTSGLMVITKSNKVAGKLVQAFTNHKITKTYIALCIGSLPKWDQISIKSGHGRSKFGVWRVYAASDVGRILPGGSRVRDMATTFQLLSINKQGKFKEPDNKLVPPNEQEFVVIEDKSHVCDTDNVDEVLVRARPRSGRTHQIRLHCQYLGMPIRGDVKYGGVYEWEGRKFDGHALHAESLLFDHPVTGNQVEFRAPLPVWATQALQPLS